MFKRLRNSIKFKRGTSLFLVMALVVGMITTRSLLVKADIVEEIRVLEIQPGNKFNLNLSGWINQIGIKETTVNGKKVILEHVTMPEFIGKVEQLNGKYDVIIIGRNNSNITTPYRDYSGINLNGNEYNSGEGNIASGNNNMLPNGNYVENDITIKKADEIISFIKSGQLVYIDKDIVKNTSNIKSSVLYKKFNVTDNKEIEGNQNYIATEDLEDGSFDLKKVVDKFLTSEVKKRVNFNIIASEGDVNTNGQSNQNSSVGDVNKRNMEFTINIPQESGRVNVKLYLDINGDGLFKEKECYLIKENVTPQNDYKINYNIGTEFVGMLDWKIELEQLSNNTIEKVKSYYLGNIYFKYLSIENKKRIRVLQVRPDAGLDLNNNNEFKKLITNIDYNLTLETMKSSDFNLKAGKTLFLNGNYDMLIIGFADSYNSKDITEKDALDEIENFINSGQSVMFTHDTMALRVESPGSASVSLTKRFRDIVGQSRFVDKWRDKNTDNKFYELDAYKEYDPVTGTYKERKITHIDLGSKNGIIVGHALHGKKDTKATSVVYKSNDGLITNYPYELDKITNSKGEGYLSVASTHNQWYQLNLEDPDLVPWYNLSHNELNDYDSRNNYYTYSKGNITYSGTGHSNSSGDYKEPELKLFVNTIVKAERGANHAPTIESSIVSKATDTFDIETSVGSDFNFVTTAKDLDNDKVKVIVDVKGQQLVTKTINQGEPIDVKVPSNLLNVENEIVNVKVTAEDVQGAKAEKIYRLKVTKEPQISFEITGGKGLVGDDITSNVKLTKLNDKNNVINNVSLEIVSGKYNQQLIQIKNPAKVNNITFNNNVANHSYIINTPTAIPNGENITALLSYKVGDTEKKIEFNITVNSKKGEVVVVANDESGVALNIDSMATLNKGSASDTVSLLASKGSTYTWPNSRMVITTANNYKVNLTTQLGYEVKNYHVEYKDNPISNLSGNTQITNDFIINYDNPQAKVTFVVEEVAELDNTISILEIEPADSFKYTNAATNGVIITGIENTTIDIGNGIIKKVRIERISMPEFIGKVDKINGKYDVIIIGRHVEADGNLPQHQKNYKDYNTGTFESDITDRKAQEIKEFIDNGQLVYIDNRIFNSNISSTKLYKNFSQYQSGNVKNNCITTENVSNLSLNQILVKYNGMDMTSKRANLIINEYPTGDNKGTEKGNPLNRTLLYRLSIQSLQQDAVSVKLFLDVNGDGLFKEDETVYTKNNVSIPTNNLEVSYQMPNSYVGDLDWKLEIQKSNGIKTYETGNFYFRDLNGEKKVIKVLQVAPYPEEELVNNLRPSLFRDMRDGNDYAGSIDVNSSTGKYSYSNLNLKTNPTFQQLLNEVVDYDIQIDVMSVHEFNMRAGNSISNINNYVSLKHKGTDIISPTLLNTYKSKGTLTIDGNYDMVILGFSNAYSGIEDRVNQSLSTNAVDELKKFIESGQSVMFTHDTMYYENSWTNNATRAFRDWMGLSRYIDSNNSNQGDFDSTPIPHDTSGGNGNRKAIDGPATEVTKTNSALITNYPFKLEDNIEIRNTHHQWFQLNLEDEDVVPWFTLSPNLTSGLNPYDVRNNYYTFSRGNLTYSGTGENSQDNRDYPITEMRLFVNTIAKAIRGANNAPVITEFNIYNDMEISKDQSDFKFSVLFTDLDNDRIDVEVKVDGKVILTREKISSGTLIEDITINKVDYQNKKSISVDIIAKDNGGKDGKGATSKKTFNIIPTTLPIVDSQVSGNQVLVGDSFGVSITLNKTNETEKTIKSVSVKLDTPDNRFIQLASNTETPLEKNNVFGSTENKNTTLNYKFNAIGVNDNVAIKGKIIYTYDSVTKEVPIEIPVSIKKGNITVNVINGLGSELPPLTVSIANNISSKPIVNSLAVFDSIPTSNMYKITLNGISEHLRVVDGVLTRGDGSSYQTDEVEINYSNPEATYTCKVVSATVISHGIYDGFNNGNIGIYGVEQYKVDEDNAAKVAELNGEDQNIAREKAGRLYSKKSNVPFVATFDVYSNTEVVLQPDKTENVKGVPIVYKVDNTNGVTKLIKISEMTKENSMYKYKFSNVTISTKIVILYNYSFVNTTSKQYFNKVKLYELEKDAKVKINDELDDNSSLPDLF